MGDVISASQSQSVVGGEKDSAGGSAKTTARKDKRRSGGRWGGRRAEKARERLETTLPILAHGIRLKIPGTPKMVGALMQMLESANALQQQQESEEGEIRLQPPPMASGPSHALIAGPSHASVKGPAHSVAEYAPSTTTIPPMHTALDPVPPYITTSGMRSTSVNVTSAYGGVSAGTNVYQHQLPLEQDVPGAQLPATSSFLDDFFSSFMPMDTSADSLPVRCLLSLLSSTLVRPLTIFICVFRQMTSNMTSSAWPSAGGLDFFALPNSLPSPSNSDHVGSAPAPQIVPGLPILSPQEQMQMHNQNHQFRTGGYGDATALSGSVYGGAGSGMGGI